jgi:hypothetical protein
MNDGKTILKYHAKQISNAVVGDGDTYSEK